MTMFSVTFGHAFCLTTASWSQRWNGADGPHRVLADVSACAVRSPITPALLLRKQCGLSLLVGLVSLKCRKPRVAHWRCPCRSHAQQPRAKLLPDVARALSSLQNEAELLLSFDEHSCNFNSISAVTCFWRLSRLPLTTLPHGILPGCHFLRLVSYLRGAVQDGALDPRSLSNIMEAAAHLEGRRKSTQEVEEAGMQEAPAEHLLGPLLVQPCADRLLALFENGGVPNTNCALLGTMPLNAVSLGQPKDLVGGVWALAKLRMEHPAVPHAVSRWVAAHGLRSFSIIDLSRLTWALATLRSGAEAPELLQALAAAAHRQVGGAQAQEILGLSWAFAALTFTQAGQLAQDLSKQAHAKLAAFAPSTLPLLGWSLAKLGVCEVGLFDAIADIAARHSDKLSPRGLASVAWALAVARSSHPAFFAVAEDLATSRMQHFTPQALANLLWAFAKRYDFRLALVRAIATEAVIKVSHFQTQELASVMWALAALRCSAADSCGMPGAIARQAVLKVAAFSPQGLANLMWGAATLALMQKELFGVVAREVGKKASHFKPLEVSALAWAFAESLVLETAFFHAIAEYAMSRLHLFGAWGLSNLCWAFCRSRAHASGLFAAASAEVASKLGRFAPQGLANVAWAFATYGTNDPYLFHMIADAARIKVGEFTAQELTNLAWAFAKTLAKNTAFFRTVAIAALHKCDNFEAQGLSNLMWAFATCAYCRLDLVHAVARSMVVNMLHWMPQELSNIVWAFAKFAVHDQQFLRVVGTCATTVVADFSPQNLCNLLWAYATIDGRDPGLFVAVTQEALRKLKSFTFEDMAIFLWACTRLNLEEITDLRGAVLAALAEQSVSTIRVVPPLAVQFDAGRLPSEPAVLADFCDRLVVEKPTGWEVDQRSAKESMGQAGRLANYLQMYQPVRQWPIVGNDTALRGFLHRLDIPTSGLVLAAKTYAAYCDLQLQMSVGRLTRQYAFLCHGIVPYVRQDISARINWEEGSSMPSFICQWGRPSKAHLQVTARAMRKGQALSFLVIQIATGRRHQIRVCAAHIGHPAAGDAKYAAVKNFEADRIWCPRHFLHRCRLGFETSGNAGRREIASPLPPDLVEVLRDAEVWQQFATDLQSASFPE